MSPAQKEFVFAHELSHILHQDGLFLSRAEGVTTLVLSYICLAIFSLVPSPGAIVMYSFLSCVAARVILDLIVNALSRRHEKRADLEAIKAVGNNQGAIEFFTDHLEESCKGEKRLHPYLSNAAYGALWHADYTHPPLRERLEYTRNWQPEREIALIPSA